MDGASDRGWGSVRARGCKTRHGKGHPQPDCHATLITVSRFWGRQLNSGVGDTGGQTVGRLTDKSEEFARDHLAQRSRCAREVTNFWMRHANHSVQILGKTTETINGAVGSLPQEDDSRKTNRQNQRGRKGHPSVNLTPCDRANSSVHKKEDTTV